MFKLAKMMKTPSLMMRIMAVNIFTLCLFSGSFIYFNRSQEALVINELRTLENQAKMFAAAIAEGAFFSVDNHEGKLDIIKTTSLLRRLVETIPIRTRIFLKNGDMLIDSHVFSEPEGKIFIENLSTTTQTSLGAHITKTLFDYIKHISPLYQKTPLLQEYIVPRANDYEEVQQALLGKHNSMLRKNEADIFVFSAASPIQNYQEILGALHVSSYGYEIDATLTRLQLNILYIMLGSLLISLALSIYLSRTIAKPLKTLTSFTHKVSLHQDPFSLINLSQREDEIGSLARHLESMTHTLHERLKALENISSDVSHELKNPLSSLKSALETLPRLENNEQKQKLLRIIHHDIDRMHRLVSEISLFSRLPAELIREEKEFFILEEFINDFVAIYKTTGLLQQHKLLFKPPGNPLKQNKIYLNKDRMQQILHNIIDNALSFSPKDGTIKIWLEDCNMYIKIHIQDEGPGIRAEQKTKIFERFYSDRATSQDTHFGEHSGLGLSICQQILHNVGGEIEAIPVSKEQTGGHFVVKLKKQMTRSLKHKSI